MKKTKCKVIAIVNQKGGVGKTTTALNLAAALVKDGSRVLAVDLDPQGNLTTCLGYPADTLTATVSDVFTAELTQQQLPAEYALLSSSEHIHLLPSNIGLATIETQIVGLFNRDTILKNHLRKLLPMYDYIIIDCSPTLSALTYNALIAADSVLIPCQAQALSAVGLQQLIATILKVQTVNTRLKIEGVLLTMLRPNVKNERDVEAYINITLGDFVKVLPVKIPLTVKVAESILDGTSVITKEPKNKASLAYMELAKIVKEGN